MGGRGRGGLWHLKTLVTCLGSQGSLCPCSLLMIRVGRPWNLLLLLVGPGPISLMHSARSNKSSSEVDTFPRLVRPHVAAANHGEFFLALVPPLVPPLVCSCLQQWPRLGVLLLPSVHVFFCADSGLPARALVCLRASRRLGGSWIRVGFHFFPWSPWTSLGCRDRAWLTCGFFLRLPRRLPCPCSSRGLLGRLRLLGALVGRVWWCGRALFRVACFCLRKLGEPWLACP